MTAKDGHTALAQEKAFIDKTHDEALALAERARAFIIGHRTQAPANLPHAVKALMAVESMRMSTRIMQVIAWTMTQKAALDGEIGREEADKPENRLGEEAVCRDRTAHGKLSILPEPIRDMILSSEQLYERVRRLEQLKFTESSNADDNPVQRLWDRLDESDLD